MNDKTPPDKSRRELVKWLWRVPVLAVAGGAGYAAYEFYKVHFKKGKASANPKFRAADKEKIVDIAKLSHVWDYHNFVYAGIPAMVINVPDKPPGGISVGDKHFIAISRICTHQGCVVDMNTNTEAIATLFNYRPKHPEITCHCHFSIFDPLKGAEVISGPAEKPLPRIRLEHDQTTLYASGVEISS